MKKLFSMMLVLAMVLSMAPAAFAAETADAQEPAFEVVSQEDLAAELAAIEADEAADQVKEEEELREELDAETEFRRLETELRAKERTDRGSSDLELLAANYDVTVKLQFPQAATQGGTMRIYLYQAAKVDEDGFVVEYPYIWGNKTVDVKVGDKTASATFSVPKGDYFVAAYTQYVLNGSYLYKTMYFNGDGTVAANEYTAQTIAISRDKTLTIKLPTAERTISGKLKFSKALSEDTRFRVQFYSESNYSGYSIYCYFDGEKGDTSASFSVPVPAGSYRVRFNNTDNGSSAYYDVTGGLSDDYELRAYVGTFDQSVSGLTVNGDRLIAASEEEEEDISTDHQVNITVKLPEKTTVGKEYMLLLYDYQYEELWSYNDIWADAGTTQISGSFWMPKGQKFAVGYMEADYWNNISWQGPHAGARYQAESGITSQPENAKVYTMDAQDMSITVDDSRCYELTGTLKLSSARKSDLVAYAVAEFDDGDRYTGRVWFEIGETSASYTIYVPKSKSGSFDHWAAEAATSNLELNEDTRVDNKRYTLSGNATLSTITMPTPLPNVTGTISLPSGMTAPEGGLALQFMINDGNAGTYYMAEGESSIDFSFVAGLSSEEYENYINVIVLNAPDNLIDGLYYNAETAADMMDVELSIPQTVVLSGSVVVADSAKDPATTFRIRYNDENGNFNDQVRISTLPGKTTASYRLKVPKNVPCRVRVYVEADATGKVLSADQYLHADGTFGQNSEMITLSKDTTATVTFGEGKTISGTISLESGLPAGYYNGQVYAQPQSGGTNYRTSFSFTATSGTYKLAVPADQEGGWRVYCYIYTDEDSNALTDTQMYYSENGTVTAYNQSTLVNAPADGIDFLVPKAKSVSGSIIVPEAFENEYFWGNVYLFDDNGVSRSCYFESYETEYIIKVSADYTGTYRMALRLRSDYDIPGLVTDTYLYVMEDGSLSADESSARKFVIGDDGLYQDLEIPVGSSYAVKLKAPAGFSGYYEGYIYLYDLDNNTTAAQKYLEFNGSEADISLALPSAEGRYALRINLYTGPGVVTSKTYYYNTETGSWVTNTSDASELDLSAEGITVTMPKAKTISGKLVSADGSAVQMGKNGMGYSLYQKGEYSDNWVSTSATTDEQGNFTITIPSDLTGQFRLYGSVNNNEGCNVVDKGYYYKSDATAPIESWTSGDDTYYFTVGDTDVTGLKIYVNTGYVMTGTVKLSSDVTITSPYDYMGNVSVELEPEEGSSYSGYAGMEKDSANWTYSIVVPKVSTTYTLSYSVDMSSDTTSNLCEETMEQGTVTVTGSATLPDIVLQPGKHKVSVTMKNPVANSVSGDLYLELLNGDSTVKDTVEKYFNLSASGSKTFDIITKPNETASSYRLYYYAYNTNGISSYKNYYVTADGALTTDSTAAGIFSLTEDTTQAIKLMEQLPYVSGKIYLPEELDDKDFRIELSGNSYQTLEVNEATILRDGNRKYVAYTLYNNNMEPGDTFYLQYYLNTSYYSGDVLFADETVYLGEDGINCYEYYDRAYFTVPESGTAVLDFVLATWDEGAEDNLLQSAHGIDSETGELTYTFTYPGATYLAVAFHERTDTTLVINGQTYYYYNLRGAEKYFDVSDTDGTLTVTMESSNTYGKDYGFAITKIVPYYGVEAVEQPVVTALYSANGSEEATVLEDVANGKSMYVSMAAPEDFSGMVVAAVYDDDGRMLAADLCEMLFEEGYASGALRFANAEDADSLKITFMDSEWMPHNVR